MEADFARSFALINMACRQQTLITSQPIRRFFGSVIQAEILSKKKAFYFVSSSLDIDECALNSSNCDINAACNNTIGSFICQCNDGFTGNGAQCDGMHYVSHSLF